jgi:DNA-binding PadR family transcriptional regulator
VISVPKGMLRLAALRLLSESSLSGADLQNQIVRSSGGEWRPGPGSIYFLLGELRNKGMIVELPKRGGTMRRYVISSKGREELAKLSKGADAEVSKLVKLLSIYSALAGDEKLRKKVEALSGELFRP